MEPKLTKDEKKALRQTEWQEELEKERKKKLMTTLSLWGFGALLVILAIGGLIAFSQNSSSPSSAAQITMPPVTAKDQTDGPKNAKVVLTEYADFQCPACKAYYPIVKQLQQDYAGKMLLVYRFFPLQSVHRNALIASQAGYAASLQGKFWEMHDRLFETQDSWAELTDPSSVFIGFAKDLGMNTGKFTSDMNASSTQTLISDDYNAATSLGLAGTPSFFINGKLIQNPAGYDDFKKQINSALGAK